MDPVLTEWSPCLKLLGEFPCTHSSSMPSLFSFRLQPSESLPSRWCRSGVPGSEFLSLASLPLRPPWCRSLPRRASSSKRASGETELIEEHAELGRRRSVQRQFRLLVLAVALWWLGRRAEQDAPVPRWLNLLVPAVAVVVAVVAIVQMVLIGHSGAEAVWSGA